jgi:predicted dehydrogenase
MITAAIAGYGSWGRRLLRSVQGTSESLRFAAIVSRDPARIADEAAEAGAVVLPSLEAALSHPDVQAVVLATPHSQHAAQIAQCAAAGRAVFVEKPFALTHATAAAALAACPPGMVVAAGHNRRFLPAVQRLKAEITAGTLGRLLFAEANFSGNVVGRYKPGQWRASGAESPAGGLAGAGIHMIDLIVHLVAPIRRVAALSSRQVLEVDMDDTTAALFDLEGGARAVLVSLMATVPVFRLQIFGTAGTAELRGERCLVLTRADGRVETLEFPPHDIERAELEAFAHAVSGHAEYPVSRAEILNGVAAFEAVGQAAAADRWVTLP